MLNCGGLTSISLEVAIGRLGTSPLRSFEDRLDPALPHIAAGCYTITVKVRSSTPASPAARSLLSGSKRSATIRKPG